MAGQRENPRTHVNKEHRWRRDGPCALNLTDKVLSHEWPDYVQVENGVAVVSHGINWTPEGIEILNERGNPSGHVLLLNEVSTAKIASNGGLLWVNPDFQQ